MPHFSLERVPRRNLVPMDTLVANTTKQRQETKKQKQKTKSERDR